MSKRDALLARISAAAEEGKLSELNLPQSPEFVINSRGQRLHVRTSASQGPCKGLVVNLHGYGAHCSRVNFSALSSHFTSMQYHYVAFDFHGHGYSEGERHFIADHRHLLDDLGSVLAALYREEEQKTPSPALAPIAAAATAATTTDAHAPAPASAAPPAAAGDSQPLNILLPPLLTCTPFYLLGSSLSGALSLLYAQHLCNPPEKTAPEGGVFCMPAQGAQASGPPREPTWRSAFRGCILVAPALALKKPHAIVLSLLEYVVVPLVPTMLVPSWIGAQLPDSQTWESPGYIAYVVSDKAENGGLSSGSGICFRTAQSVLKMGDEVQANLPHSDFPVLILHDPNDAICLYSGSDRARGLVPDPAKVELVDMPGALHDVLTNRLDEALGKIDAWLERY